MPVNLRYANLEISRIIMHEIYQRNYDGEATPPLLSGSLVNLNDAGLQTLQNRIIQSIGRESKSIQLEIQDASETGTFQISAKLLYCNDENFISSSKIIAQKLNSSQHSRIIPGGILIIFNGRIGDPAKNIVGIIKAEMHEGFSKNLIGENLTMEYLNSLLLTPQQRLYKIGIFIEDTQIRQNDLRETEEFAVYVYDHNINRGDLNVAANYFYNTFLGCGFAESDKKKTKDFFNYTNQFIQNLNVNDEKKLDLTSSLITYLKVDQNTQINVMEYADRYLTNRQKDDYRNFMGENNVPLISFRKNISLITNKLKRRLIKFTNNVKIILPINENENLIKVTEETDEKTVIEIKGKIEVQS